MSQIVNVGWGVIGRGGDYYSRDASTRKGDEEAGSRNNILHKCNFIENSILKTDMDLILTKCLFCFKMGA